MIDLADQLDFEDEARHDFYSWPRGETWGTGTPAARIREVVAAKMKGVTDE